MRLFSKILAGIVLAVLAYIALGGLITAAASPLKMRGEMIDIGGGRRMHLICEGPPKGSPEGKGPTVLFEAGAFGFSADWGVVQERTVARGWRACSYDRAGLGLSDPGPEPRDGLAVVGDLERLLKAAHEDGPFIIVGHSMAGLYLWLFANRNPDKVKGLVFVDATTPQVTATPQGRNFVQQFSRASNLAAFGAEAGLYAPLAGTWFGDKIGLTREASAEKRRAFASPRHNHWAAIEVGQWVKAADQARATGPLNPDWPVAVVMAGGNRRPLVGKNVRTLPADEARHGHVDVIPGAGHATLLGKRYADAVVDAIAKVRKDAGLGT
jgi:pimeloyl-ACP methyl ester carboxylesterase